ncbi:MAG TPA: DUF6263 family protein [Chitinophagaceae bacterium]|nr:DUF6263 family protein [Chitinophagaceae bacterium]
MNKLNIFFVFILWMAIGLQSCGTKESLELNLKPGMDYHLNTQTYFEGEKTLMGQKQLSNLDLTQNIKFHVLRFENNEYQGLLTFPKMILNVNLNVGVLTINSEEPNENPLSHVFAAMKNEGLNVSIDKKGNVKLGQSMDEYFDHILNVLQIATFTLEDKLELKAQLLEQFNDRSIQSQLEQFTKIAPAQSVKHGSKWKLEYNQTEPVGGKLENQYEIIDSTNLTWTVSITGNLNPDKKAAPVEVQGYETKFKMKGDLIGEIVIDKVSGWPIEGNLNQNYQGELLMQVNDKETKVPATIKAETILKP